MHYRHTATSIVENYAQVLVLLVENPDLFNIKKERERKRKREREKEREGERERERERETEKERNQTY